MPKIRPSISHAHLPPRKSGARLFSGAKLAIEWDMLTQEDIQNALKAVKYPGFSRDIVSFGLVKEISAANGAVSVAMQLTSPNPDAAQQIKTESRTRVEDVARRESRSGRSAATRRRPGRAGQSVCKSKVPGVKRVIAIASGKGGVGKSTVSANLACALQHLGAQGRLAGLRHLRAEHSADDGRARAADHQRGGTARAARRARREGDEHRFAARRTTSR